MPTTVKYIPRLGNFFKDYEFKAGGKTISGSTSYSTDLKDLAKKKGAKEPITLKKVSHF